MPPLALGRGEGGRHRRSWTNGRVGASAARRSRQRRQRRGVLGGVGVGVGVAGGIGRGSCPAWRRNTASRWTLGMWSVLDGLVALAAKQRRERMAGGRTPSNVDGIF